MVGKVQNKCSLIFQIDMSLHKQNNLFHIQFNISSVLLFLFYEARHQIFLTNEYMLFHSVLKYVTCRNCMSCACKLEEKCTQKEIFITSIDNNV